MIDQMVWPILQSKENATQNQRRNVKGYGDESPNVENLLVRRAKTVLQCISSGQLTGPRTIGQLLLTTRL